MWMEGLTRCDDLLTPTQSRFEEARIIHLIILAIRGSSPVLLPNGQHEWERSLLFDQSSGFFRSVSYTISIWCLMRTL
jgi:hypothetical protein